MDQAKINKYITELNKLSKKKLIRIIMALTADVSNLQIQNEKLKKGGKIDKPMHTNDKAGKPAIITTD